MPKLASFILLAGAAMIALTAPACADPPGRVGRVSLIEGSLSMKDDDTRSWVYAELNQPVTTGDAFWTQNGSRAELQVGGTSVRVDGGTELGVIRLDDSATELTVAQGAVSVEIAYPPPGGVVVDTPQGRVTMNRPGLYSIVADAGDDDGSDASQVTVFGGDAAVDSLNSHVDLRRGESGLWSSGPPSFDTVAAQDSAFDQWVRQRDAILRPAVAAEYITPEMTGYGDLGTYGDWNTVPEYGTVWYPNDVAADWVPYRDGRWEYVQPWGWTWVDSHPWGFAPFHYGRWVQTGGRWGWWPGDQPRAARPVYAPALVAFLSFGHGSSRVSIADGPAVGWVPLAPNEVYRPWYSRDPGYWQRVNRPFVSPAQVNTISQTTINNATVVNNYYYSNRAAALAVPAAVFGQGRVAPQHVPAVAVQQAVALNGTAGSPPVPLRPGRHNDRVMAQEGIAPAPAAITPLRPGRHNDRVMQAEGIDVGTAPASPAAAVPEPLRPGRHNDRVMQAEGIAPAFAPATAPVPLRPGRHNDRVMQAEGIAIPPAATPAPEPLRPGRHNDRVMQAEGIAPVSKASPVAPAPEAVPRRHHENAAPPAQNAMPRGAAPVRDEQGGQPTPERREDKPILATPGANPTPDAARAPQPPGNVH